MLVLEHIGLKRVAIVHLICLLQGRFPVLDGVNTELLGVEVVSKQNLLMPCVHALLSGPHR